MTRFGALVARDLRLVWRRPGDAAVVLAFFLLAASLFPLGVGPALETLARIAPGVLHGILTALVTGIAMVGMHDSVYPNDPKLVMAKFGIKLVIAIVVAALVIVGTREPAKVTTRFLGAIAGLVVVNVTLAVLWT